MGMPIQVIKEPMPQGKKGALSNSAGGNISNLTSERVWQYSPQLLIGKQ
jgi:hypothetical protein